MPPRPILVAMLTVLIGLTVSGCRGPNKANIELRKQNQSLEDQIAQCQRQRDADRATILGYQAHATTVPTLPQSRLDQLFTAAGLKFGRLTGGYRPQADLPADTMVKVYVVPVDEQGDALKAAGAFKIELFDLALAQNNRIGEWNFDNDRSRRQWFGGALLYTYVFDCSWQTPPQHPKLLLRATFNDALTGRIITQDKEITVMPPAK